MDNMPNYLDYSFLFENYTSDELELAWKAIHDSEIEQELYESGNALLCFMVNTEMQGMLFLYMEDINNHKLHKKEE